MNDITVPAAVLDIDAKQVNTLSPSEYKRAVRRLGPISVEPYAPVVGAHVGGYRFDAARAADEETRSFLYQSLLEYGFLVFAPGSIQEADFEDFTKLFGNARFAGNPRTPRAGEKSEANAIDSSYKKTRTNYIWHIDQAYRPQPQRFTALFAVKVPAVGGETLFSNAVAAYNLFDPLFAQYLDTLTVIHDADTQGLLSLAYAEPEALAAARVKNPPIEVPLIRVNPDTGHKQIFANELYAQRVLGVSRTVSDSLLTIVFEQIRLPEVGATVKWAEGAVVIWDNRTVHHRGVYNYEDQRRVLIRAVIE